MMKIDWEMELGRGTPTARTKLYNVWRNMRKRCNAPNSEAYPSYGGRGIKICKAWNDYIKFSAWAKQSGYRHGLTIDRINGDKGYKPSNCRWATRREQVLNRKATRYVTWDGKTQCVTDWAKTLGVTQGALHHYARRHKIDVRHVVLNRLAEI